MAFQVLIILAGLVVGWIKRGSIWNVSSLKLRLWWILPVAYVLQHISVVYLNGVAYEAMIIISYVLMIGICTINFNSAGLSWILSGTIANFVALVVNGLRMPAYMPAVKALAPQIIHQLEAGTYGKSIAMSSSTHLNFLGDIFAFNIYPQSLISVGDILLAIGFVILIQNAMLSGHKGTAINA